MAVIKKDGGNMALPIAIKRGNPIALDTTSVWYSKTDMETYAKSGATAYVGQYLVYVDEAKSAVEAYVIANAAGTLLKLSTTTASGDLASDVATLQAQVADLIGRVENLEEEVPKKMPIAGGIFTGAVSVPAPTADAHAATKKYVDDAIGEITGIDFQVVENLPETGTKGVIYLVKHEHGSGDSYDEYIWVGTAFEKIGNTDIDLTDYAKKTDVTAEIGKLDVTDITVGADSTLTAIGETDGKIHATATKIQITESQVTGLTDALAGKQVKDDILTSLSNIAGSGLIKKGEGKTLTVDTNQYLVEKDLADYAKSSDVTTEIATAIENLQDEAEVNALIDAKLENYYDKTAIDGKVDTINSSINAVSGKATANETAISAINNATTGILAQAKKYTDDNKYDDTTLKASVKKNTDDIAAINNTETGILKTAKDYADSKASANKTLIDAIGERVTANETAIAGKASTTALNSEIDRAKEAEKANADALSDYKTTNDAAVAAAKKAGTDAADAVTALANGQVATNKTNIETLQGQIGGLTGAMHFKGSVTALPTEGDFTDGDVILISTTNKEYVYDSKIGTTIQEHWVELGDEGSYALKTTKINNKPLSSDITLTAADVGAEAAGNVDKAINALSTDAVGGKGYYIQAITQTDGKISANAVAMPEALKNPNALTIGSKTYDGSAAAEVTAADLGALTEITTTANGGLKVTDKNKIDIDTDVTFVLNGGSAAG